MPKELEQRLEAQANKKGLTGKKKAAYIYGTMRKTGWSPKTKGIHRARALMAKT